MTDPAIIEAGARALQSASAWTIGTNTARAYVETVLAYAKPGIESAALERAAKIAEDYDGEFEEVHMAQGDIAAAIRALKEQP